MLIQGQTIDLEALRVELQQKFYPAFGIGLDIAEMIQPLESPQDGDLRLVAPPPELQDIYNPKLMDYQWRRLVNVVRNPVQELITSNGFRALQVLSQTVLLFLPNGLLHAWVWDQDQQLGMQLKRASHDAVALMGRHFEHDWFTRLAEFATHEIRTHVCFDEHRAYGYAQWTFDVFGKVLAQHADLPWMRSRIGHLLALDPKITEIANQTISSFELPGSLAVSQYNAARRRLAVLNDIRRDSPQLIGLYALMCTHPHFAQTGEPVQRLKHFLKSKGLTQSGWTMVLKLSSSDFDVVREFYAGSMQLAILDYLLILDGLGLHEQQPRGLIESVFRAGGVIPNELGSLCALFESQGYLKLAAHVVRLYCCGQIQGGDGLKDDINVVLEWLNTVRKPLTRAQKQGGWSWLLSRAKEWQIDEYLSELAQSNRWSVPFTTMKVGPYVLRALVSSHDLWIEGNAMRHCVGSYVSHCASGESLLVSVSTTAKAVATAEYRRGGDTWCLHTALGPRNTPLQPKIESALRAAAEKFGPVRSNPLVSVQSGEKNESNNNKVG
jgi:hypothetical protein